MSFSVKGIVSGVYERGVSDKVINIITEDRGRLSVLVKGGKKAGSRMTSLSQLFTYADYEIDEKKGLYILRDGSLIRSFYEKINEVRSFALASYLCQVANDLSDEGEDSSQLLSLLVNTVYLINEGKKELELVKAVFELRAASDAGYRPDISSCAYCGELPRDGMFLDIVGGECFCESCLHRRHDKTRRELASMEDVHEATEISFLSDSVLSAVGYVMDAPIKRAFAFDLSDDESKRSFCSFSESYLLSHTEHEYSTLDFYKTVSKDF